MNFAAAGDFGMSRRILANFVIGLFIDGAHLSISWGQVSSLQLDFEKLKAHIALSASWSHRFRRD